MRARPPVVLGLLAAVILVPAAAIAARPRDAPLSSDLRPLLEPARQQAQHAAGPVGLLLPFALAEVLCSADRRTAVLAFDSSFGWIRAFAIVGLPPDSAPGTPGSATAIVGQSAEEFAASPDFSALSVGPCDHQ